MSATSCAACRGGGALWPALQGRGHRTTTGSKASSVTTERGKEYNTTRREVVVVTTLVVIPLGGPLGPYRYSQGTPRTVPRTSYRTVPSWSGLRPSRNGALGSMAQYCPGEEVPEQRSCSSVPVSSAILTRYPGTLPGSLGQVLDRSRSPLDRVSGPHRA